MRLICQEFRKVFIKRGLLIIFALLLLYEVGVTVLGVRSAVTLDKVSLGVYLGYVDRFRGEVTDEKAAEIYTLIAGHDRDLSEYNALTKEFAGGGMDREEYDSRSRELAQSLAGSDGYNAFYTLFENAVAGSGYIADTTVWAVLLKKGSIDAALVFAAVYAVTAAVVSDEENGSGRLRFTTVNGKARLWLTDLAVISSAVILLCVCSCFARLCAASLSYGLGCGDLPVRAIYLYATSGLDISMIEAYFLSWLSKTAGTLMLSFIALAVGAFTGSSLYTFFISVCSVYLPSYLLADNRWGYLLPLPGGLISGTGLFAVTPYGSVTLDENTGLEISAAGMTPAALLAFIAMTAAVCAVFVLLSYRRLVKRRSV